MPFAAQETLWRCVYSSTKGADFETIRDAWTASSRGSRWGCAFYMSKDDGDTLDVVWYVAVFAIISFVVFLCSFFSLIWMSVLFDFDWGFLLQFRFRCYNQEVKRT